MTQLHSHDLPGALRQASVFAGAAIIVVAILGLADSLSTWGERAAGKVVPEVTAKAERAAPTSGDGSMATGKETREKAPRGRSPGG